MPAERLLRFVVDGAGRLTPDLAENLPGRGVWISADKEGLLKGLESGQLVKRASRSLKTRVSPDIDAQALVQLIDRLLTENCLGAIGLARKSGQLAAGFEKVRSGMEKGAFGLLFLASDAADDARRKQKQMLDRQTRPVPLVELFSRTQLGKAIGRGETVHAGLMSGGLAERTLSRVLRLGAYRGKAEGLILERA